ncbi:MAG: hypothetical protein M1160_02225 [Candidatus Marsarchaeota archaeon]|nr:hypothetical protein [Candidatus Marsarchaeota archaeon]
MESSSIVRAGTPTDIVPKQSMARSLMQEIGDIGSYAGDKKRIAFLNSLRGLIFENSDPDDKFSGGISRSVAAERIFYVPWSEERLQSLLRMDREGLLRLLREEPPLVVEISFLDGSFLYFIGTNGNHRVAASAATGIQDVPIVVEARWTCGLLGRHVEWLVEEAGERARRWLERSEASSSG